MMTRATIAGATLVTLIVLLVFAANPAVEQGVGARAATSLATTLPTATTDEANGFLYGRVTLEDGTTYEGRLRFGGDEEALWSNYFNGVKRENPWASHAPLERLTEKDPIEIFGVTVFLWERQTDLSRPVMARFGDIARIDAHSREQWVTLKSGTVLRLARFAADDFADGVRVWDGTRGVVNLGEWGIRSIEFLPTAQHEAAAARLHGTVRTGHGDFTGFIQWHREQCVGSDLLVGYNADGDLRLRFDTIRSIARRSRDSSLATLLDGREIVLSSHRGNRHRGIYVDDRRFGRVLVSWDAFERVDFSAGANGPAYTDFPPGRPLSGTVITRAGRQLTGRLVYDLDESETTETLDAPSQGVDYTIPLGLVASIVPACGDERGARRARVTLHDGGELQLDCAGDLGERNVGMLIFAGGYERPEYVPWTDVAQIDFDRPPAMFPPLGAR